MTCGSFSPPVRDDRVGLNRETRPSTGSEQAKGHESREMLSWPSLSPTRGSEKVLLVTQIHQTVPQGGDHSMRPVVGLELGDDGADVILDGALGQVQPGTDLLVR